MHSLSVNNSRSCRTLFKNLTVSFILLLKREDMRERLEWKLVIDGWWPGSLVTTHKSDQRHMCGRSKERKQKNHTWHLNHCTMANTATRQKYHFQIHITSRDTRVYLHVPCSPAAEPASVTQHTSQLALRKTRLQYSTFAKKIRARLQHNTTWQSVSIVTARFTIHIVGSHDVRFRYFSRRRNYGARRGCVPPNFSHAWGPPNMCKWQSGICCNVIRHIWSIPINLSAVVVPLISIVN